MRILMLAQFYYPIVGGIEQHVRTLSIELAECGHDVAVATMRHKGQPEFEIDQGVRVYRIRSSMQRLPMLFSSQGRQYTPPFPDPEIMLELRRIILKEQPEIVHAHNWLGRSFLPLKSWSKAKLVVTLHDYNHACPKVDLMYGKAPCNGPGLTKCLGCAIKHYGAARGAPTVVINRAMARVEEGAVDMYVAVSQAVATGNRLVGSKLPFRVISNFIADDAGILRGDAESYLAQLPAEGYLLYVGALGRVKGVEVLLRAYDKLTSAPPLVLIGYQTPDWQAMAVHCPRNVLTLQDWPHHAVMAAWERCMLALVPSIWHDPCPTVAMEAMSMGKPVIATRMGGLTDIVADGETGILVPAGDPEILSESIQWLLDDPTLRLHMGKMAKQRVIGFQAKSIVPRIEQVYSDVLQGATAISSPEHVSSNA